MKQLDPDASLCPGFILKMNFVRMSYFTLNQCAYSEVDITLPSGGKSLSSSLSRRTWIGGVLELADRHDLGSCALWREGSSPSFPTEPQIFVEFFY